MIVATAGHVDHGKTLLIKTLTGVDTDRLEEEKRRGLTIDIGFAYLPIESAAEPIGFIDVPGHEKFIRNMVCGVAGIDFALFVIAADDGPMPQSREHLSILDLLGVRCGIVVLTKTDRVAADRLAEVRDEIEELTLGTVLENAPIRAVSAMTGDGIGELRDELTGAAHTFAARKPSGHFRLAVDRRFDITGAGLIVTGTVFAGACHVGDQVRILGHDGSFRIRSIRAQNEARDTAHIGQRAALNLTGSGLSRDIVGRGDWIVARPDAAPVVKFDVRLHVLASETGPFNHWTPVHVHLGASETTGRAAVLDGKTIQPGENALAQIVVDNPLGVHHGDGFIIRDQSATRTIGGGQVIDIAPPLRRRGSPERRAMLRALETSDHARALKAAISIAENGVDLEAFARARNLTQNNIESALSEADARAIAAGNATRVFSGDGWQALKDRAIKALSDWHAANPQQVGLGDIPLLRAAGFRFPTAIAAAVAMGLEQDGAIVREALGYRLPSHQAGLAGDDAELWRKVSALMEDDGLRPASLNDLAKSLQMQPKRLQSFLVSVGRHKLAHRISNTRYITSNQLNTLKGLAVETAAASGGQLDVRAFRDASGIGRNMAIEVLEHFDKIGITARRGDLREIND